MPIDFEKICTRRHNTLSLLRADPHKGGQVPLQKFFLPRTRKKNSKVLNAYAGFQLQ